jgi:lysophospholipid acyltransferase (LPLAT)-like uncharacterized protein
LCYPYEKKKGCAVLALIDENGYPTASTLTIAKADGIKWLTFNTSLSRDSVKRIKNCNRASICINFSEYNITLVGTIEVLTDPDTKKTCGFPLWKGNGAALTIRNTAYYFLLQNATALLWVMKKLRKNCNFPVMPEIV